MLKKSPILTPELIQKHVTHLKEQERSAAAIQKYTHDINALAEYLHDEMFLLQQMGRVC